jgi:hypothetical protein
VKRGISIIIVKKLWRLLGWKYSAYEANTKRTCSVGQKPLGKCSFGRPVDRTTARQSFGSLWGWNKYATQSWDYPKVNYRMGINVSLPRNYSGKRTNKLRNNLWTLMDALYYNNLPCIVLWGWRWCLLFEHSERRQCKKGLTGTKGKPHVRFT